MYLQYVVSIARAICYKCSRHRWSLGLTFLVYLLRTAFLWLSYFHNFILVDVRVPCLPKIIEFWWYDVQWLCYFSKIFKFLSWVLQLTQSLLLLAHSPLYDGSIKGPHAGSLCQELVERKFCLTLFSLYLNGWKIAFVMYRWTIRLAYHILFLMY